MLREPVPVVLCVDVEPDDRYPVRRGPEPFAGLEALSALIERLRDRVADRTGAPLRVNWMLRMDPQIATALGSPTYLLEEHPELVDARASYGDELGLHIHAYRLTAQARCNDLGDPAWVDHCIASSVDAFASAIGDRCQVTRMGDRFLSDRAVAALDAAGVVADLTLEPGTRATTRLNGGELSTGLVPDQRRVPRVAYRPSVHDYRRGGDPALALTLVPLTSANVRRRGVLDRTRALARGAVDLVADGSWPMASRRVVAPWAQHRSPNDFVTLIRRAVAEQRDPYLAFAVRTSLRPDLVPRVEQAVGLLVAQPWRVRFVSATEVAARQGDRTV